MLIHYIDVGQGDSTLIQVNNKNLLIDSGPSNSKNDLLAYLESRQIDKIDYLIATHPHEDHIGNMSSIINNYEVKSFYAPKIITNTSCFEKMTEALVSKNLKINVITPENKSINLGKNTNVSILAPNTTNYSDNLNNYSAILKIQYKNTSFLFTGDTEEASENEVLSKNYNIKSDVLKVAHHGSSTSTSSNFYKSVNPSIAIISVAKDNQYNHPNEKIIKMIKDSNTLLFRTDLDGTIILSSDGNTISKK